LAQKGQLLIARRTALAVFAVFAIAELMPGRALAHEGLKSSVPAKGAHLGVAPRELRLTLTERPELQFTRIQLLGPDSALALLGSLRIDSTTKVVADIRGPLTAGTYTVVWQTQVRTVTRSGVVTRSRSPRAPPV
jgi:methionine-rich copper-binding protein CopC